MPDKPQSSDRELLIRIDERVQSLARELREFKKTISSKFVEHDEFTSLKADVTWIKKFFWIVAAAGVGGLISGVIALLFK